MHPKGRNEVEDGEAVALGFSGVAGEIQFIINAMYIACISPVEVLFIFYLFFRIT